MGIEPTLPGYEPDVLTVILPWSSGAQESNLLSLRLWALYGYSVPLARKCWWQVSNLQLPACKAGTLPVELHQHIVLTTGLEPITSRLSAECAHQLRQVSISFEADDETWTHNLSLTRRLHYRLCYTSILSVPKAIRTPTTEFVAPPSIH